MFSLICTRTNDWVNNRDPGDLRRHRGHYDVIVIKCEFLKVNNAGAVSSGGLAATSLEGFDKMYNANVRSVVMVTKKALPKIIENKGNVNHNNVRCGLKLNVLR